MQKRVLVIDDERATLSMFRLFLKALGYEVITAPNGDEGVARFKEHRPPVVLTDVKMAGMDGFDVLSAIKAVDPRTAVILITGHGDVDLERKAMELEASGFVHKPLERETIQQALQRAEEQWKAAGGA